MALTTGPLEWLCTPHRQGIWVSLDCSTQPSFSVYRLKSAKRFGESEMTPSFLSTNFVIYFAHNSKKYEQQTWFGILLLGENDARLQET